jgi:glycosyltransferase involved in cell wall biosynthesis
LKVDSSATEEANRPAAAASSVTLWVFDENLIPNSPAGSCLLKVVETVTGQMPLRLFFNRLELADAWQLRKTHIPLPSGPIVVRAVLFTLFSGCAYLFSRRNKNIVRLSTQGVFPFCDLSYAHFCHLSFMRNHFDSLGGGFFRRGSRILTHTWACITERMAFKSARTIVVPSEGLARELSESYPKLVANKIQVIANPVDTLLYARPVSFSKDSMRAELGFNPSDLVLCFCALGNFERKGLRLVLEALRADTPVLAKLLVVGGSASEIRDYEKLCLKLGIADDIRFVGLKRDIRPYLWTSDAFIFPSAYEVFSLVCLQAAAAGLPLITTKIYGVEEYMVHGETGWVVDRASSSIRAAIQEAFTNRLQTACMGRQAQQRVQMYSEDEFRRRWRTLLEHETTKR